MRYRICSIISAPWSVRRARGQSGSRCRRWCSRWRACRCTFRCCSAPLTCRSGSRQWPAREWSLCRRSSAAFWQVRAWCDVITVLLQRTSYYIIQYLNGETTETHRFVAHGTTSTPLAMTYLFDQVISILKIYMSQTTSSQNRGAINKSFLLLQVCYTWLTISL